ncbi:MAG: WD40/YVTN/BNR-like repeat-containing protein [Steroidobacteraceae bacterium]
MRPILALATAALLGTSLVASAAIAVKPKHPDPFQGLKFRDLGPAVAGGRVTSVLGAAGHPALYYVGTAGGGVWKTQDGGMSWKAIFTHEPTQSIGSLALAGGNPNWLWVGTGESNPRNDVLNGDGVYFSPDGGKTWVDKGLHGAGQIAAIAVDPQNTNTVFVCATGDLWKRGPQRGVYMSTDDGAHWRRVLYLNDHTGCSTIAFEPGNPKVLIAGMWPLQRRAWLLTSGGKSGGLYRSTDGGVHWKKLTHGLPAGPIGRSAVAFAPSEPQTVYAVLQAKGGVLWVSHDLGSHWSKVSDNHNNDVRPFYFTQLAVMPNNPQRLFLLSMKMMESKDGGKHVFYADKGVHVDHHTIWIDPNNPDRIIQGNDGGVYLSLDAGKHWRHLDNLPIEQFYQVATSATNHPWPYLVCGGLQDNDAWCGASSDYDRGGVTGAQDWFDVSGGDGQYVVPAPNDAAMIYSTTDDGFATVLNRATGLKREINPYLRDVLAGLLLSGKPPYAQKYRFDWTTPMAVSPTNPKSVYTAADVVFHSTDGGRHWSIISPDLTRNVKAKQQPSGGPVTLDMSGAETYDTIQSLALAPTDPHVIWVGTDDGLVWVSRDDGAHWSKVTPPGAPQWARVYHVEPSPFSAGTAYAAFDGHEIGNDAPYVYRTTDYGKHWTRITRGLPESSVEVVAEDPNHAGLLFAGTISSGLYVSFDDGGHWQPLHANLPRGLSVWDLTFAPDHRGMLLATHGRGIWVLDNLRPLEQYSAAVAHAPFHVFTAAPGVLLYETHTNGVGPSAYVAPNAPTGAVITYHLAKALKPTAAQKAAHHGPVRITIRDAAGTVVTTLHGPGKAGFDAVVWNLSYKGPAKLNPPLGTAGHGGGFGPSALPGQYSATLHAGAYTQRVKLKVESDPRYHVPLATDRADTAAGLAAREELSAVNRLLNHVSAMRTTLAGVLARGNSDAAWAQQHAALLAQGKKLEKTLTSYQDVLWNPHTQHDAAEDFLRHFSHLHRKVGTLYGMSAGLWGAKPRAQILQLIRADRAKIEQLLTRYNDSLLSEVKAWNSQAYAAGVSTLPTGSPVRLNSPPALPPAAGA